MEFNFGLLKQTIKAQYGSNYKFAESLGIPKQRLSRLLNNQSEWNPSLIYETAEKLGVWNDLKLYFFTPQVHND